MEFPMSRLKPHTLVVLTSLALSQSALAALSLQDLQPIAHFPAGCEAAYATPIQQCPPASSFSLSGSGGSNSVCTQDCFNALNKASTNIQLACQGTAAPPGTVIAHAFYGDLATWLCSLGSQSSSQPTSAAGPSNTTPTTGNTSPAGPSSTGGISESTSASASSSGSGSTSSPSPISSTDSTSVPSSTPTIGPSSTTVTTQTSKSKSSTTKPPTSSTSTGIPNDGSPFDQTVVPNAAPTPVHGQHILPLAVGVVFAVAVGS